MRVLSAVFGTILFVIGLAMLSFGVATTFGAAGNAVSPDADWICTPNGTVQTCRYLSGSMPQTQIDVTASLAVVIMGAALAVCGTIFVLIGTNRSAQVRLPAPVPYGPPFTGQPGQPPGAPPALRPYPPQG
ncbi:MAG: hypothetical protein DLM59_09340 [Pseudonocardiales bacterium]|nr:MAG: hypothetical protein DLM59_09340 [Pseudonocardiales bacterium]